MNETGFYTCYIQREGKCETGVAGLWVQAGASGRAGRKARNDSGHQSLNSPGALPGRVAKALLYGTENSKVLPQPDTDSTPMSVFSHLLPRRDLLIVIGTHIAEKIVEEKSPNTCKTH